jgi:hypothetical protein
MAALQVRKHPVVQDHLSGPGVYNGVVFIYREQVKDGMVDVFLDSFSPVVFRLTLETQAGELVTFDELNFQGSSLAVILGELSRLLRQLGCAGQACILSAKELD